MTNNEMCECGHEKIWHKSHTVSNESWTTCYGEEHIQPCDCSSFRPQKENKKEPMPTIDKYIKAFKKVFPLLRVFPSPENGQEIERFCDEEIQSWLSHALQTYGEERYEEGWSEAKVIGLELDKAHRGTEKAIREYWENEVNAECEKAREQGKADGIAQGIRRGRKDIMFIVNDTATFDKDSEYTHKWGARTAEEFRDKVYEKIKALLPPNE